MRNPANTTWFCALTPKGTRHIDGHAPEDSLKRLREAASKIAASEIDEALRRISLDRRVEVLKARIDDVRDAAARQLSDDERKRVMNEMFEILGELAK